VDTEATVAEDEGAGVTTGEQEQAAPATDEQAIPGEESEANATRAGPEEVQENPAEAVMRAPLRVPAAAKQVDATITKFEIQNLDGSTADKVFVTDKFYLSMDWDASANGADLHEGDWFDVTLPDAMKFPSSTTAADFDVRADDGTVIAHAHVTPGAGDKGGTVRVTFGDWVEGKENVHGNIHLAAQFDRETVEENEDNTFEVTVGSQVTPVTVEVTGPKDLNDEYLGKWGGSVAGHADQAEWTVRLNHTKATLTNVVISDHLTGGTGSETYIADSFVLRRVEMDSKGNVTQVLETQTGDLGGKLSIAPDGRSFTINLGDVDGDQYRLNYKTTYVPGTTLHNNVGLTSTEQTKTYTATHVSAESGGSGSGNLANKIKLTKVDADGTTPLAGAVFQVTRPDGSTFELTTGADGTVTSGSLTSGTYKVRETTAPSGYELDDQEYTLTVSPDGGALQTITDEPIKISIDVTKEWVGPEGGPVTVHLMADGADTGKTLTLSADNGWTGSFDGLRQYQAGSATEIVYTVSEDPVEGYSPEVAGSVTDGFTVTNTNTEKVSVPVTKVWVGPEGASATVRLLADGNDTGKTLTLTANDGWEGAFGGLDRYDPADGHEIEYTVSEDPVEGYTSEVSGDAEHGFTVTNTNTEKVSIPVTKTWVGPKGSGVTVKLLADSEDTGKTVTLDEGNGWSGSFTGLDKYSADGSEIAYTVTEAGVSGVDADKYTTSVTGDAASGFTITNTNKETVDVSGTKAWDDDGDRDGVRPASITVNLLADGSKVDSKKVTADGGWAYSFSGLAKYDPTDGHEIAYTVTEDAVPNYATAISGTDITNSYTPGRTSVTVTKAWDDANDQDGIRTGSVMVQLYANGEPTGDAVELSADNQWTHTWTDLFQRDGGKDVAYTVEETEVPEGYTATVSGDATAGFTVTNAHEPETISVSVTKRWVGPEGGPVAIHLLADGIDTGKTLTLSADNGWTGSFDDLAKNKDGRAVEYTVSEDPVEGYTSEVSGDAEHGFTVTNTKEPKVPKGHEPGRPTPRRSDRERLPQTGDEGTLPIAPLVGHLSWPSLRRPSHAAGCPQ
jgi:uncharacterized surface anchored protein